MCPPPLPADGEGAAADTRRPHCPQGWRICHLTTTGGLAQPAEVLRLRAVKEYIYAMVAPCTAAPLPIGPPLLTVAVFLAIGGSPVPAAAPQLQEADDPARARHPPGSCRAGAAASAAC
jgi:hypothetical protein